MFEDGEFYQVKDVARRLNVSPATIYRAIKSGKLASVQFGVGKGTRIEGSAANAYVSALRSAGAGVA